jgi:hypothetical protein
MRPGPAAIAVLLLAPALILPGCGGEQTSAADAEKSTGRTTEATTTKVPTATSAAAAGDRPAAQRCRRSLGGFLDSMESLNNSLAVGLGYDDYLTAVNQVRSTYAPIRADQLSFFCLTQIASPAERALNTYIEAANLWGDCLAAASCDSESIEPKLQGKWARASDLLSQARSGT